MSRGGVQGFQKDRLSQILAARRLTQVQLASMVDVSPATISKWRAGTQTPERDALETPSAGVVNVTPEWFTRARGQKLSLPLFRSNASAHVAARAMLEARLEWAQDVAAALMEYVDYPDVNLPTRDYTEPEQITNEDIEKAACECRDLWRLGRSATEDLALAVEGAGIIVVREETGIAQIEGLSAWSEVLGRPLILLSADKDNGYRSDSISPTRLACVLASSHSAHNRQRASQADGSSRHTVSQVHSCCRPKRSPARCACRRRWMTCCS